MQNRSLEKRKNVIVIHAKQITKYSHSLRHLLDYSRKQRLHSLRRLVAVGFPVRWIDNMAQVTVEHRRYETLDRLAPSEFTNNECWFEKKRKRKKKDKRKKPTANRFENGAEQLGFNFTVYVGINNVAKEFQSLIIDLPTAVVSTQCYN